MSQYVKGLTNIAGSLFLALLSSPLHAKGSAIAFPGAPATLSTLMGLVCSTGLLPLEGGAREITSQNQGGLADGVDRSRS